MKAAEVSAKKGTSIKRAINEQVLSIVKGKLSLISLKDIYMQFLLFFEEEFDDDLLQDAMETIFHD